MIEIQFLSTSILHTNTPTVPLRLTDARGNLMYKNLVLVPLIPNSTGLAFCFCWVQVLRHNMFYLALLISSCVVKTTLATENNEKFRFVYSAQCEARCLSKVSVEVLFQEPDCAFWLIFHPQKHAWPNLWTSDSGTLLLMANISSFILLSKSNFAGPFIN